jgi:hypothetical protein
VVTAALSIFEYTSSEIPKLSYLIRFFTHFPISFRVHICLRQLATMMAAYTRKSLQQLDQADVYAPRIRHSHASGGVVSHLIQVRSTLVLCVPSMFDS